VDENNVTSLRFAAQFDHIDIVRYLLSKGASTKIAAKDGRDPLNSAVEKRNLEVVRALLEAGAGTKLSRREQGRQDKIWALK
jgi:ankyrin repeat protein